MKNKAVIFDMNGVLIQDEPIHEKAFSIALKELGVYLTPEDYRQLIMGRTDAAGLGNYKKVKSLDIDSEKFLKRKMELYYSLLDNPPIPEGLYQLIQSLEKKYKIALTTNASLEEVNLITRGYGIRRFFEIVVTREDFNNGKPHPEPYLTTAKKLEILPQNCIVIEDTNVGVLAAKTAGMKCIAITSTQSRENLSKADQIVDEFPEITAELLESLLQ